ncbi:MAG TPA: outer membrane protein assembly factor BamE [Gemmatimonadaceae bacterium]
MVRLILALSFVAATAHAQTGAGTIDPGMTRAQVIERLGTPATIRTYQGSTYLMYSNKCGKKCGMQDLVILEHDSVVDAVLRSPDRHYTGTSSSPEATAPNARSQRNQSLAVPAAPAAQPTAAERVAPGTLHQPADSATTSTSRTPDDAQTSTSRAPADSAPTRAATAPVPYGKPSPTPPPADSSRTLTSHPPADNASSSTSHPPKPPK